MNAKTKALLLTIIIGFVLVFFLYSQFGVKEALAAFKNFTIKPLLIFLFCVITIEILGAIRWKLILTANKIELKLLNVLQYRLSGFAVGYLSPQPNIGGDPIRALLLKKHKIKFKKAFSTVLIDRSIQTLTDLFFAFIIISYLFISVSISFQMKLVLFLLVFAPFSIIIYYFYCMIKKKPFFSAIFKIKILDRKLNKFKKGILDVEKRIHYFHTKNIRAFIKTIFINIIIWILIVTQYSAAMTLFGFKPRLFEVFVLMAGASIASGVPLPMNLGALELSQITALSFLKIENSIGLSMSLLIRFVDIIRMSIGILSLFYFGVNFGFIIKQIKGKNGKNNQRIS